MRFHTPGRPPSCSGRRAAVTALAAVLLGLAASPSSAQNGSGSGAPPDSATAADEKAARIARADSVRATLRQPPGARDGATAMDVIRAPFELLGGTVALALVAGYGVYQVLDEAGITDAALGARDFLARSDLHVDPDFIGSRSWPALVATYRGLDPLFFQAGYSLRRYELYGAGLSLGDERRGGELAGRYHLLRELNFWGVGPDSRSQDRSDYALTRKEVGGGVHGRIGFLRLGIGSAWEQHDVDRGFDASRPDLQDTFDPDELPGAGPTTDFLRWDVEVDADLTTIRNLHHQGVRLIGSYRLHRGVNGTDADFHSVAADLRTYLPVNRRQALAVRLLAEDRLGEGPEGVPFTHLATLGDDDGLRGYTSRRFTDRALLAAQAEWRYEVWWHPGSATRRVEGFAFADYGTVAPSLSDVDRGDFRFTPGLGARLNYDGIGVLEGYLAFGGDAPRTDVTLGVTF